MKNPMLYTAPTIYALLFSFFVQCHGSVETESNPVFFSAHDFELPYSLKDPMVKYELDHDLQEISGLSLSPDRKSLFAIQDEKGKIFQLDKASGEILKKVKFHKDGDYEGIEVVGDRIFVVKSNGKLYEIRNFDSSDQELIKHEFFLEKKNDIEGLGYDPLQNRLLIACKGWPATGESFKEAKGKKVIYAFDLETNEMPFDPVYTIKLADIQQYLGKSMLENKTENLMDFFEGTEGSLTFNPSAIAVHPVSGNLYITSSAGKILMVLDRNGRLLHLEKMKKKIHRQPEGLVFDRDGTLYISNEGKDGKGSISVFKMK